MNEFLPPHGGTQLGHEQGWSQFEDTHLGRGPHKNTPRGGIWKWWMWHRVPLPCSALVCGLEFISQAELYWAAPAEFLGYQLSGRALLTQTVMSLTSGEQGRESSFEWADSKTGAEAAA